MNLKRQLLLVSLLTLMLPWAGCQFIRETESALREGQQQMLAATARALANSMAQYREEFPDPHNTAAAADQLYLHALAARPEIDGYFDDWRLEADSLRSIRGVDGPIRFAIGSFGQSVYLFVEVTDRKVVYASSPSFVLDDSSWHADRIRLVSMSPPYLRESISFAAEAPGGILSYRESANGIIPEPTVTAHWQDMPGGYRLEARIPSSLLGTHLGIVVSNTGDASRSGTSSGSFSGREPGMTVRPSAEIETIGNRLLQPGMRLLITDAKGWRLAAVGRLGADTPAEAGVGLTRRAYDLIVESGSRSEFAEPDPLGREQQPYVSAALQGREMASWFRGENNGQAIVAVASPIADGSTALGAVVLQQGTDAILSLTNEGLARLIRLTLIATLLVAGTLLGYATWLSRRIRRLSVAAEAAVDNEALQAALPSSLDGDEVGDLSRSFSSVLQQLGNYNDYLKSLASKLSHELRTPLAIVTSSLENLDHEPLSEAGLEYTQRARDGAERLRRVLNAMSEANRVEELVSTIDPERFDLRKVLESAAASYRDVYNERSIDFYCDTDSADITGSPELLIQMLDKLVDNAVGFSQRGDSIRLRLSSADDELLLSVTNPGPPLPERMRTQLFDPMVSMRPEKSARHLGLGLYIAQLIATGHGGRIRARNEEGGVVFEVLLPGISPAVDSDA
ncbi:MAG: hypothetical protein KJO46_03505 [Gammaproteobacteria bacterium]|nr:hypothetical protein [Gammaproteobacteria bacterium]